MLQRASSRLLFAALLLAWSLPRLHAAELCGRNVVSLQALHDELTKDTTAERLRDDAHFVAFSDTRGQSVWTFTKAAHAAYPAVVCRRPVRRGDQLEIQMQVMCGAAKQACDALVESFKGLNDRVRQELKR